MIPERPRPKRLPPTLGAALLFVVAMVWPCRPAHAHAVLTSSAPPDGATVDRSPREAILTFNESPDPVLSRVRVLDGFGAEVQAGKVELVPGRPTQLRVPLRPLGEGPYRVLWRVTSVVDGHTTTGTVTFGVGVGVGVAVGVAGPQGVPVTDEAPLPGAASIAGRWLLYAGLVLLVGAAVVAVMAPADRHTLSRPLLGAAWAAAAAGPLVTILDQRSATGAGLSELLSSPTGHKLRTQVAAVALAGAAVAWASLRRSRAAFALVGLVSALAMLARAQAGHASASSARWFTIGAQWVHLVSVGIWVGGLVWLLVALRAQGRARAPELVRRYSTTAAWTLVFVALSGLARAWDEVAGWAELFDTRFGVTLLVKLALFAALVALGGLSRWRHVPAALHGRTRGLLGSVRAEVAVGMAVLLATAVLTGLPPPASLARGARSGPAADLAVTGHDYGTSVRVRLVVSPGSVGSNRFDLTAIDYDSGDPVGAKKVSLRFRLPDRADVAASSLVLTRDPDTHWRAWAPVLSLAGRWQVTALVETAADAVQVPLEVDVRPGGLVRADPMGTAERSCGEGRPDARYRVTAESEPDPPRAEGTAFHLTLRRDGGTLTGAKVCLAADMPDMQHPGISTVAREVGGGRYDAELRFAMTGAWAAAVTIAEPGQPVVSVPVTFEVK